MYFIVFDINGNTDWILDVNLILTLFISRWLGVFTELFLFF